MLPKIHLMPMLFFLMRSIQKEQQTCGQLQVHAYQIGAPIVLVNHSHVDEILKVEYIKIGCTFVLKNEHANQEQKVTPQCTSSMVLNLHVITFGVHNLL